MQKLRARERQDVPGLIRASFGIYNTLAEVNALVDVLDRICSGDYQGDYLYNAATGALEPGAEGERKTSTELWSARNCT